MITITRKHFTVIFIGLIVLLLVARAPALLTIFSDARAGITGTEGTNSSFSEVLQVTEPVAQVVSEVQAIVPAGSRIEMSPADYTYPRVYSRYLLYPEQQLDDNWEYYIDLTRSIESPSPDWTKTILPSGIPVYAKADVTPHGPTQETESSTTIQNTGAFLFLIVSYLVIGFMILNAVRIHHQWGGPLWFLGTSFLVGLITINFFMWTLGLIGVFLTASTLYILIGALFVVFLLFSAKPTLQLLQSLRTTERVRDQRTHLSPYTLTLFFISGAIVVSLVIITLTFPLVSWDAVSYWIIKSKAIFYHQDFIFSYTHQNYYPLLWPLHNALHFIVSGHINDIFLKWYIVVFQLVFISQLVGAFRMVSQKKLIAWYSVALYILLFFSFNLTTARSDSLYMALIAGLLGSIIVFIKSKFQWRSLMLIGLTGLGVGMMRLDGIATLIIVGIGLLIFFSKFLDRKKIAAILFVSFLPALVELVWIVYLANVGYLDNLSNHLHAQAQTSLMKFGLIVLTVPGALFYFTTYGIVFVLAIVVMVMLGQRLTREERLYSFIIIALILLMVPVMSGWTIDNILHNFNLVTDRLLLRTTPFLAVLLVSILARSTVQFRRSA